MFRIRPFFVLLAVSLLIVVQVYADPVKPPQDVNVVNPQVTTRDADNAARQPFQVHGFPDIGDGYYFATFSFNVPAGKRLVMEYVSAIVNVPSGQKVAVWVNANQGSGPVSHYVVPTSLGAFNQLTETFAVGQLTRIYADPSTQVDVVVDRNAGVGFTSANVSVSGYLVNVP